MSERMCPYCKQGKLITIQHLENTITMECNACGRLLLLQKESGIWRPLIDTAAVAASAVTLLHFFEIDSWDEFVDTLTDNF